MSRHPSDLIMRMVTRNLSKIGTFDAGPKTGKWHQKPPMVRTFCELTEIKMNESEYDILCKRLDFFFRRFLIPQHWF